MGIPKSNVQYHFSKKSRIKLVAELDGFTANIQDGLLIDQNKTAETINMSIIICGLRYEYKFTKHMELYCNFGNILYSSAKLRDSKKVKIISINKDNTVYLRTGLRFKI